MHSHMCERKGRKPGSGRGLKNVRGALPAPDTFAPPLSKSYLHPCKAIGYELKKEQTEAIYSVLSGSNVLSVVLPTSFDKSMIYQALL